MPTNRVRTRRNAYIVISPEAIELYRRCKDLQARGFEGSDEYRELTFKLINIELKLKPWQPSVLYPMGSKPPADVPKNLQHFWHSAKNLQRSLDAAVAKIQTPLGRSKRVVDFQQSVP